VVVAIRRHARQGNAAASAILANICVAVSQSTKLCSISTVSQANPARARNRAAVILPSDSQLPNAG
jgi:hypothetical protein